MIFDAIDQEVIFDLPSQKGSVGVVDVVGWDDWVLFVIELIEVYIRRITVGLKNV